MEELYQNIKRIFNKPNLPIEKSNAKVVYLYDNDRTFISESKKSNALEIKNANGEEIHHICVDGVLIPLGRPYPDGTKHGRNDCLVFTKDKLYFVELKMNMSSKNKDEFTKKTEEAIEQIVDFQRYISDKFDGNLMNNFTDRKYTAFIGIPRAKAVNFRSHLDTCQENLRKQFKNIPELKIGYELTIKKVEQQSKK